MSNFSWIQLTCSMAVLPSSLLGSATEKPRPSFNLSWGVGERAASLLNFRLLPCNLSPMMGPRKVVISVITSWVRFVHTRWKPELYNSFLNHDAGHSRRSTVGPQNSKEKDGGVRGPLNPLFLSQSAALFKTNFIHWASAERDMRLKTESHVYSLTSAAQGRLPSP